jgi:hypothetical protein
MIYTLRNSGYPFTDAPEFSLLATSVLLVPAERVRVSRNSPALGVLKKKQLLLAPQLIKFRV